MKPRVAAARLRERFFRLRERLPRGALPVAGTVLVLAVGGVVLTRTLDVEAVVSAATDADPAFLTAALVVYLASWPVRGRRYGDVLAPMGHRCRTAFLTAAVFASQTANLIVPARAGDGVRAYLLNDRREVPYPTGVASLAVERAFDLVALGALGGTAFAVLLLNGRTVAPDGSGRAVAAAAALALAAAVGSAGVVAVARSDRRFGPALRERAAESRLSSAVDAAVRFGAAVRVVAADAGALVRVSLASGVVWAADVATAVLVLAALLGGFGTAVDPVALCVVGTLAVSAGNLAKVLPLSQGGIGLYEAAFTGIVVAATPIPAAVALAAAALDHALKNAVTLAGGGLVAAALDLSVTRAPDDSDREPDAGATRPTTDR
ncbi:MULTISPECIES: lysylphosphatidylglycerol synthase transmembrane domain-containing protein [unclassified Halorubrum]|uniref:lysylphosphatidylglycerol synthase transmembrane domain-containing protein n=1 Tax=unclassified Halorubrum TaxID=2642239 RepID=UPI0010F997B6|nr:MULTISPECIES: lysylphosphatidylglycerol synthase transmembrane domain-containing protein [unclassified Halorubrum]TKX43190.1 flippase-like domain-containing protein [Halorubrum sp. ARQ200]TKX49685.1 flippase-like domain-containing protein [Halorubrum sp. ASP121]